MNTWGWVFFILILFIAGAIIIQLVKRWNAAKEEIVQLKHDNRDLIHRLRFITQQLNQFQIENQTLIENNQILEEKTHQLQSKVNDLEERLIRKAGRQ